MAISANFTVNAAANPAAHSVAYDATVTLALTSITGVGGVEWSIIGGSNSGTAFPTITPSATGHTASFDQVSDPADGLGRTFLVKCRVFNERESAVSYAVVGTANDSGGIPLASGEENHRDATFGWVDFINSLGGGTSGFPIGDYPEILGYNLIGGHVAVRYTDEATDYGFEDITTAFRAETSGGALGSGAVAGYWRISGPKTLDFELKVTFGAGFSTGTGAHWFKVLPEDNLPAPFDDYEIEDVIWSRVTIFDTSAPTATVYGRAAIVSDARYVGVFVENGASGGSAVGGTTPITFAAGDYIRISGSLKLLLPPC